MLLRTTERIQGVPGGSTGRRRTSWTKSTEHQLLFPLLRGSWDLLTPFGAYGCRSPRRSERGSGSSVGDLGGGARVAMARSRGWAQRRVVGADSGPEQTP